VTEVERGTLIDAVTGLRNHNAFQEDLEQELARVRRYHHRITVLLAELDGENENSGTCLEDAAILKEVGGCLSDALRTSDAIYRLAATRFGAILPSTHEAGGEAAALRVKRLIAERVPQRLQVPCSVSIGVVSVHPQDSTDFRELHDALERDLQQDKECQAVSLPVPGPDLQSGDVLVFTGGSHASDQLCSALEARGYAVLQTQSVDAWPAMLKGQTDAVAVLTHDLPGEIKVSICKKIGFNRMLDNIYIIWIEDFGKASTHRPDIAHEFVSPEADIGYTLDRITFAFKTLRLRQASTERQRLLGILDAIGSASHQLNQPLQGVIGRTEVLLLNTSDGEMAAGLTEIRSQALRAADVNQKIARLVRS